MQSRYKVIISSRGIYKEIDLLPDVALVSVGTENECEVRLRKDMFFDVVRLEFIQRNNQWTIICSDNLYIYTGDVRKLLTKALNHGDTFFIRYQDSNADVFSVTFLIDFNNGQRKFERAIDISSSTIIKIGVDKNNNIILNSKFVRNDAIEIMRNQKG